MFLFQAGKSLILGTFYCVFRDYDRWKPEVPWCFAVLFGDSGKECASYFCLILEEVDCVLEEPYPGEGAVRLDERKMKGLPFFQIWVKDRKKTVIRMDLAESLLMRHAVGLELQEVVIT